ncbi:cytochrome c oxidase assembly protein [Dactylosporangium sp. AC04546]|uniref:cytochrome c oxidase assembly protein n=1 Tax=Dactylosporangium sp. AC04546 TaxID=2862460 RepID=UPI001EE11278|nr:cytochrome c oxidase assembly protein [Dactylosporangium sp. AC04546]WVK80387.1 cytochrome c oxidase assembly protein [Dactylosporangium sp. AC04546]
MLALHVVSLYGLYFSDLLGTLMRYHLGHLAMLTHFVLVGFLFFWVLIGIDPGRRAVAPPILLLLVVRWIRADEREQRRLDRAADRADATGEEDDLARYNAFLRQAAEATERR